MKDIIVKKINDLLSDDYKNQLSFSEIKKGYSMYLYSNVLLRIDASLKSKYRITFLNNSEINEFIPLNLNAVKKEIKDTNGNVTITYQIEIEKQDEVLLTTLDSLSLAIVEQSKFIFENHAPAMTFGCCGKYLECSDAKDCLQKYIDYEYAKGCSYRKNLESGRIFYGKNKNV